MVDSEEKVALNIEWTAPEGFEGKAGEYKFTGQLASVDKNVVIPEDKATETVVVTIIAKSIFDAAEAAVKEYTEASEASEATPLAAVMADALIKAGLTDVVEANAAAYVAAFKETEATNATIATIQDIINSVNKKEELTIVSAVATQGIDEKTTVNATVDNGIVFELEVGSYTEKIDITFNKAITGLATGDIIFLGDNEYGTVALSEDQKTLTIKTSVTVDEGKLNSDGSNSTGHIPVEAANATLTLEFKDANQSEIAIKDLNGNALVGSITLTIKAITSAE